MLFGQLLNEKELLKNNNFPDVDLIEGTFFLGSQKAIKKFKDEFWNIHDKFYDQGR